MENKVKKERKNKVPRLVSLALMLTLITTCLLSGTLAKYVSALSGDDSARVAKFNFDGSASSFVYGKKLASGDTEITPTTSLITGTVELFSETYYNAGGIETVGAAAPAVAPGVGGYIILSLGGEAEVATRLSITVEEDQTADINGNEIPIFYKYGTKYYANDAALAYYGAELADIATTDLYLNLSNADTTAPGRFDTQLTNTNYGGSLDNLAADSTTAIGAAASLTNGVIEPGTQLMNLTNFDGKISWYWPFEVATYDSAEYTIISDTIDTNLGAAYDSADTDMANIELKLGMTLTQVD